MPDYTKYYAQTDNGRVFGASQSEVSKAVGDRKVTGWSGYSDGKWAGIDTPVISGAESAITPQTGSYKVRAGDTLWGIAEANLGSGSRWRELGFAGDPKSLSVGTELNIPTTKAQEKSSDTISSDTVAGLGTNENLLDPELGNASSEMPDAFSATQNIERLTAGMQQILDNKKKIYDELNTKLIESEADLTKAETTQTGLVDRFKSFWTGKQTPEEIMKEKYDQYGIDDTFEEVSGLSTQLYEFDNQLAKIEEKEGLELEDAGQAGMPNVWIQGRKALIQRQYSYIKTGLMAQKGALASHIEALQGNLENARLLAGDYVKASLSNLERDYNHLVSTIDLNADRIARYDSSYRDILGKTLATREDEYNRLFEEKTKIMDLVLNSPKAFNGSDIDSLSYADAVSRVRTYDSSQGGTSGWEIRTVGNKLYRVNPDTGALDLLAEDKDNLSKTEKLQLATSEMGTRLTNYLSGKNAKYVAPATWLKEKRDWVAKGFGADEFIKNFYTYINPAGDGVDRYGSKESQFLSEGGGGFTIIPQ